MKTKFYLAFMILFATSVTQIMADEAPKGRPKKVRNFHYVQTVIYPREALPAGASWRLDGSNWQDSKNILAVGPGKHFIEFHPLEGYRKPDNQKFTIGESDTDVRINAKFTKISSQTKPTTIIVPTRLYSSGGAVFPGSDQPGNPFTLYQLTGLITPREAIAAGARWKLDGTPNFSRSGDSISLPPAKYTVRFKADVIGWFPDHRTVEVDLRNGSAVARSNYHRN